MCPCRAFNFFLFVFARYLCFRFFLDMCVLRNPTFPTFPVKKNEARQGQMKHMRKFEGSYLSKTVWTFGLVCGEVQNRGFVS